jgi:hypothetical protein
MCSTCPLRNLTQQKLVYRAMHKRPGLFGRRLCGMRAYQWWRHTFKKHTGPIASAWMREAGAQRRTAGRAWLDDGRCKPPTTNMLSAAPGHNSELRITTGRIQEAVDPVPH